MISHHFDNPRFLVNFKMKFYFFFWEVDRHWLHTCMPVHFLKRIEILMKKHNDKLEYTILTCCVMTLTPVIYLVQGHIIHKMAFILKYYTLIAVFNTMI